MDGVNVGVTGQSGQPIVPNDDAMQSGRTILLGSCCSRESQRLKVKVGKLVGDHI